MATNEITSLYFTSHTPALQIRETIKQHCHSLTELAILNEEFFLNDHFVGLELPVLTDFIIAGFDNIKTSKSWESIQKLPLKRLGAASSYASDRTLENLSDAPWWQTLSQFEVIFLQLNKTTKWKSLWSGRKMSMQILSLFYIEENYFAETLSASFPELSYLIIGTELSDSTLKLLPKAENLTALQDLELRHTNIKKDAAKSFIQTAPGELPSLRRVGLSYYSDRRKEILDWNGALVDYDYEPMNESEINDQFFKGSKLHLLPANRSLTDRIQSPRSARMEFLKRM